MNLPIIKIKVNYILGGLLKILIRYFNFETSFQACKILQF